MDGVEPLGAADLCAHDAGQTDEYRRPSSQHGHRAENEGVGRGDLDAEPAKRDRTGADQRRQRHQQRNHPRGFRQVLDRREPQRAQRQKIDHDDEAPDPGSRLVHEFKYWAGKRRKPRSGGRPARGLARARAGSEFGRYFSPNRANRVAPVGPERTICSFSLLANRLTRCSSPWATARSPISAW